MDWITSIPVAHRGLHDAARGIIENSPSAFEAAARAGYAIELDVNLSSDGEAIVFHDSTLDRVTKETGKVRERTTEELTQIVIDGSADTIPTLGDVMDQVGGRVPLLIEIKNMSMQLGEVEARVADLLKGYKGAAAVQSFNPFCMGWFAEHAPEIARGQISESYFHDEEYKNLTANQKFQLTNLLLNGVSKPHFVAYNCRHLPAFPVENVRARGLPVISWTVRDEETAARIAPYVDNFIFEGFELPIPSEVAHG